VETDANKRARLRQGECREALFVENFFKKKIEKDLNHLLSDTVNSTRVGLPARSFLNENVATHSDSPKSFFDHFAARR